MTAEAPHDNFLWLEDIHSPQAMDWVTRHNQRTEDLLVTEDLKELEARALEVMDSTDKIPMVSKQGDFYYNFWRDADHPRGLFRRTTWDSWVGDNPQWDVLLDLDQLAAREQIPWVWAGSRLLRPQYTDGHWRRALISMTPDGGDARRVREFDLIQRRFVAPEDGGFDLPVAKTSASWEDADTLLVATDTGPGTLTASSYPAQVRRLKRGMALGDAPVVFQVPHHHVQAWAGKDHTPGFERTLAMDVIDFFRSVTYILDAEGTPVPIDVPESVEVQIHKQWLLLRPQEPWETNGQTYAPGTLLAAQLEAFQSGKTALSVVFEPTEHTSLQGWSWTADHLVLQLLHNVSSAIQVVSPGTWTSTQYGVDLHHHSTSVWAVDDEDPQHGNDVWVSTSGFLSPTTVLRGTVGTPAESAPPREVKRAPSFFDAQALSVEQHWATSADGTKVPYYQVGPRELVLDGRNPVLLSGYGGFEVSRTPAYSGVTGRSWLTRAHSTHANDDGPVAPGRTGVYVVANIRGGGEFGPDWHRAALKENRHRAYQDFAAVARDLHDRGVCTPATLACSGGSNGGLLVGNMLVSYPELFGGISCGVPLLDMRRYTKLSAGTSWIAEYGDPDDPADWEFMRTFSPYHLVRDDAEYPPVLFWTATSDDRVGPVQARKMAALMQEQGHPNVWFHETLEGGHAGAGDNKQAARSHALSTQFLWRAVTGTLD
ncbi:prolyl oligopeptidase family serine peptidase [Kocuria sp.]|uniref:prolyl oligopeptidase family serine peptidase n=1 Tax=Kocuria sp. TaxID=1871328 RepID=UPI0026DF689A|nr:prolyl oligopeptidase family serine peptidase [Kocuria sp.]MDO5617988.1 prolyl oligopeptidase family serine peptidase [Kocuria sp.]